MKRSRGVAFVLGFVLIVVCFVGFNALLTKADSFVVRKGYIENVEDNVVTIVDTTGTMWKWEQDEQTFDRWDNVKMIVDNNNTTSTKEDDIILKVRLDK